MRKKLLSVVLMMLISAFGYSQTLYWFGGSGNWSDINHWSLTSGNSGGLLATSIPQGGDNVMFDANSGFTGTDKTVTINQISICNDITVTGIPTSPTFNGSIGNPLQIKGNANYQTGTIINNATYYISSNVGTTINYNGGVTGSGYSYFHGSGSWLLSGSLISTGNMFFTKGSLDFGSSNITMVVFSDTDPGNGTPFPITEPRSLSLGTSTINLTFGNNSSGLWRYTGTNLNAGTSQINLTGPSYITSAPGFSGKTGHSYFNVAFTNFAADINYYPGISGGNMTFNTVSFAKDGGLAGNQTINKLIVANGGKYYLQPGSAQNVNQIVDNTPDCQILWELTGGNPSLASPVATINCPNPITLNNVKIKGVNASGVGPFIINNGIDLGYNAGWTFNNSSKNLYWIGGGGNWTDASHWTTNTDGTPIPGGCVPTRYDNVFFNNFSGTISAASPVVVNNATPECKNITWTGVAGTPVLKTGTTAAALNIYGSSTWQNGMVYQVYNTNYLSKALGNTLISNGVNIEGTTNFSSAGGWIFNDAFNSPANNINFNAGSLNTNGQLVTIQDFGPFERASRTLTLGSSTINVNGTWYYQLYNSSTPGNILNAGTSQINMTSALGNGYFFSDGGYTYYNVSFTKNTGLIYFYPGHGTAPLNFNNLSFSADALIGAPYNEYDIQAPINVSKLTLAPSKTYKLGANLTAAIFNANTPSCSTLMQIQPFFANSKAILKLLSPQTITNAKVTGIDASNGSSLTVSGGTDGGNNVNVLITPTPPRDFYWIGGTGNWNDITHWTLNADGTANPVGGCLPLVTDNVFFNQYSGTNYTVNIDAVAYCNNMTWEEVAGSTPTLKGLEANILNIGGSLVLQTGMDYDVERTYFVATTTGNTITTHGVAMDYASTNTTFKGVYFRGTGSYTLNDTFNVKNFAAYHGTFNTNNNTINAENFDSEGGNYSVNPNDAIGNFGSSIINIAGFWATNFATTNAGTSVINMNATMPSTNVNGGGITNGNFFGGLQTYYNLNFTSTTVKGTINGYGSGSTFNNVTFANDAEISGDNNFNVITFAPNKKVALSSGRTQTVNNIVNNTSCGTWQLDSYGSGAATQAIIKSTNNITLNNVDVSNIKATGGGTFTAIGINRLNNTGITFSAPTGKSYYWIGGTGNWDDPTHWTTNADGTPSGGKCLPTRYDDVFFNSFSGTSPAIFAALITEFHNMTWSGVPGTPSMPYGYGGYVKAYGSVTLQSSLSIGKDSFTFLSTEAGKTITTNGASFTAMMFNGTGEYVLQDDLTASNIIFTNGTLNTNGKTVSATLFTSLTSTQTSLILGASNIYVKGSYYSGSGLWNYFGNLDAGTSHIYLNGYAPDFTAKDVRFITQLFLIMFLI